MSKCAVILTALPCEYNAVRSHLTNLKEETHLKGNVYERGLFVSQYSSLEIGIVQVRKGNVKAGVQTERAIAHFKPNILLFVGIAGGLKDVNLGDVVAAEKVYGYESGKAKTSSFEPRPDIGIPSFRLIERAQAEGRKDDWLQQINGGIPLSVPHAFVGPIAAGEKVIASKRSSIYKFLKTNYGDAIAVEMEGHGFLEAAHANREVDALVIRGISDLISGKSIVDKAGWQEIAARHASAFAFQILTRLIETGEIEVTTLIPNDIKELLENGSDLRCLGKYEEARNVLQRALEVASGYGHKIAIARAKYFMAVMILNEWDKNYIGAKALLQESLQEFRTANVDKYIADALSQLGFIEIDGGNLDVAEACASQALELYKKKEMKEDIAHTLLQLGWIEDHRSNSVGALDLYDQALKYFLSIHQEGNIKAEKTLIQGIAGCYHHKGLIYEHSGNVVEVETNYLKALEWYRKSIFKPDIAKILYLLARLKYREGKYDDGTIYLDEATKIYREIGDHCWHARCLDLKGRLYFTLGKTKKAIANFESALNALGSTCDYKEKERYLNKLGNVFMEEREFETAKEYYEQARKLSANEEFLDGYATAVEGLAKIAHTQKNYDERNKLLLEGVSALEKLQLSVQAQSRRAFITGQIGFFYERMENIQEALIYYERAKKAFEAISDTGGVANSLGSIARMKGILGKKNEEFDTYRELKVIITGSPYYDLIAGTAINLGEIHMQLGNLDEAKLLFEEAEFLCQKYNLHYMDHLKKSMNSLRKQINLRKPPELTFNQLIEELFELVEWFPEAKDSILRLWLWGRHDTLLSYYRNTVGIKFMLCQDDVNVFLRASGDLHPYVDLCLQAVGSEYPGTGIDIIPYPPDKKIFFDCAIPTVERRGDIHMVSFLCGGINSRYSLTSSRAKSEVTGNEGVIFTGWSLGLPEQAHQLIFSHSAAELTEQKIFFLPNERFLANDKLLCDLRFTKELGLIPVYFDSLPDSENVGVSTSASINFPILSPTEAYNNRKQIKDIKQSLSRLLSVNYDSVQVEINNLMSKVEELSDLFEKRPSISVQTYVLDFRTAWQKMLQVAFVIQP